MLQGRRLASARLLRSQIEHQLSDAVKARVYSRVSRSVLARRRFVLFATLTVVLSLGVCVLVLLAADVYVHKRFETVAGVNIWGYRGPVVGRKRPNEIRLVALGGSTVINFGLPFEESFPHQLEMELNRSPERAGRSFSVVNLGFNNEGAYTFQYTLADYQYLHYDIAILYEGYNDLSAPNRRFLRHESAVFRWTGYYPLLPIVAGEKVMQLRSGDIHEAYRGRVVFRPSAVARTKAALLEASLSIVRSVENAAATQHLAPPIVEDNGCSPRWQDYCHGVAAGIDAALARHSAALVVTQPYLSDLHRWQQHDLAEMIARRYGSNPLVMYVNLGETVDKTDPALCWDGMHLLAPGNALIARGLMPAVLRMLESPRFTSR
jgi:lysophospholipase L1-like esterase